MWCLGTSFGVNGWTQGTCRFFSQPKQFYDPVNYKISFSFAQRKSLHWGQSCAATECIDLGNHSAKRRGTEKSLKIWIPDIATQTHLLLSRASAGTSEIVLDSQGTKHPEGSNRDILHRSLEMTIPPPWVVSAPRVRSLLPIQQRWDSWSHRMVGVGVGVGFGVEGALKNIHSHPLTTGRDIFHWNLTPKIQRLSLQKNSQQLDSSNLEYSWTQIKAPAKRSSHWCKATNCWHQAQRWEWDLQLPAGLFHSYIIIFMTALLPVRTRTEHQADDAVPADRVLPLNTRS